MRITILLLLSCILSGCVTESDGVLFSRDVDKPKAIKSHVDAASQYLREGDATSALRHLRKAQVLDPNSQQVHASLAVAFELTQDYDLAEKHHKKAIRIKGDRQTSTLNNYGVFLYKRGRYAEAKKQLVKVVADALYERRASAFASLGLCELRLNEPVLASKAFKRALALDRRNGTALIELATLALKNNNVALAQRYNQQYSLGNRVSPRSLILGIQIADVNGNDQQFNENAKTLKTLYPQSAEYARFLRQYKRD